jgi:hypothetical protein
MFGEFARLQPLDPRAARASLRKTRIENENVGPSI